jgi:hypothetical protein
VAILLLFRPILGMDTMVWGPADPWNNGDFLGAHWLFWSMAQPGDSVAALNWPWGEAALMASFPNPFDAWLLGGLLSGVAWPLGWNVMMLGHHLLNVVATVVLARAAGVRTLHAAAAGALIASTPLMLHEHALGHTLTAAVWPGLFGLAALLAGRGVLAGIWIGIQGLAYLYTGLAVGLVALVLRPARGLMVAVLVMVPYLLFLFPQLEVASAGSPPAGFTSLPIDGLWGGAGQSMVRLQPLLWLSLFGFIGGRRRPHLVRLLVAALVLLFFAIGPSVVLHRGETPLFGSPLSWLLAAPGLSRMHHPIRLGMLAAPLLAVAVAVSLQRRRAVFSLILIGLCGLSWRVIDNTAAWSQTGDIPGAASARWLRDNATGVVDLGSDSMQALSLQTIHGKPILSGFHPRDRPRPGLDRSVFERVGMWAEGVPQPGLPERLKQLGYSHIVVVDRGPGRTPSSKAVEAQLGAPVGPGVYAL